MNCDRCNNEIPDTQIYKYSLGDIQYTLCRTCVNQIKDIIKDFFSKYRVIGSHPKGIIPDSDGTLYVPIPHDNPTREKIGIPSDYIPYKYNIIERVSRKPSKEPKHEGRKPTNIFSKLFYMMFFEKVE